MLDTVIDRESIDVVFDRTASLYAWRVQARNGFDISPWSDTVYVSTIVDSSISIVPLYPIHGTIAAKGSDVFRFQGHEKFYSYEVGVTRDPRFNATDFKLYCFTDSVTYSFLTEGERYYWRIVGSTLSGEQFVSQVATMVINTNMDVDDVAITNEQISCERQGDGIVLKMNALQSIASVRVYTALGQCINETGPFVSADEIRISTHLQGPCFIVVTFSTGKTYFLRA